MKYLKIGQAYNTRQRQKAGGPELELAKLRKALSYEKLVTKTAQRIIRRNAWGPFSGLDAKKNGTRQ